MINLLKKGVKAILKPFLIRIVRSAVIDGIRRAEENNWLRGIDLPEEKIADVVVSFFEGKGEVEITEEARTMAVRVLSNTHKNV